MISQRERGELARFYTVTDPKKHQKGYTVYKVTARIISRKTPEDVQEITVWKRYSDFRKLHRDLWQLHKNLCSQSELFPPFAKTKVFGRFDDSVIEERRQCSEDLLQFSANIPALYSSQHIQDFFEGGEVQDGSELIGPAEPCSDYLADSLSECGFEVPQDIGGAEDLNVTGHSEDGGPSSESDLTFLPLAKDSLDELDNGMASGCDAPNQPLGGATASSSPSPSPCSPASPAAEVRRPSRAALFPSSLRRASPHAKEPKADYLDRASEQIRLAAEKEAESDYQSALLCYRRGVDLLLQGVQGEPSPTRREAVKTRTAEYLMRAEQLSNQYLRGSMGQGSTQTMATEPQCSPVTTRGSQQTPSEELRAYRVLGVIDKVLLVLDNRTQETFILKGLRKSSEGSRTKRTVMPRSVPNMVPLRKVVVSEDTVFLLLQYAEGGKLWSHIGKFLRSSSPEDSFDIPFIQKSHTTAVHSARHAAPRLGLGSNSSGSGPGGGSGLETQVTTVPSFPPKGGLLPGLLSDLGSRPDSAATSEEECTNSYLTLCNEYELEKVEPDSLEEEGGEPKEGEEGEGGFSGGLEASSRDATATTSSRSRSLLSSDSLCSPVSAQELHFFTEASDGAGEPPRGPDHGEVFSPLPSPAAPLSLDQSKQTPLEFFRIDSKDSASEVTCPDPGEPAVPSKPLPLYLTSEGDGTAKLAREVKGRGAERWGPDCSDTGSVESVPVISFEEALAEDEGQPPDLLVNLPEVVAPGLGEAPDPLEEELQASGVCLALEAHGSPQRCAQPDVLQLHSQPAEGELTLTWELPSVSAFPSDGRSSAPATTSDRRGVALGWEASRSADQEQKMDLPSANSPKERLFADSRRNTALGLDKDGASAGTVPVDKHLPGAGAAVDGRFALAPRSPENGRRSDGSVDGEEGDVSRLFAELDALSAAASQARVPEEFVRCWGVEMVRALDGLHQEGVVCRDLHPRNVLLDHQGHVQLTYFCSWNEVEESLDREATANMYCAPEVGGIQEETAACDWWSLGAILFELLSGKSLLQCHPAGFSRHTALNVPEFVSEEASSLLEQLLQFNPTERLGAGVAGVDDIKSHPFFARVDWPK
ncbi:ribosomal protein S6 kinase delta-1 [Aplochiton taeniatus]